MNFKEFLNRVCGQIQFKPIRTQIAEEMENHLNEAKENYMLQGMQEIEAEEQVIRQMGKAEEIGKSLNQIHRPKLDWKLLLLTCILLIFGGLVCFTRTMNSNYGYHSFYGYGLALLLGTIFSVSVYFIDYGKILKKPEYWYGLATLLAILVINFGTAINGAKMYFSILGRNVFVPSLVVLLDILAFAGFLLKIDLTQNIKIGFSENKGFHVPFDILKIVILSGISLGLLLLIPATPLCFLLGIIYLTMASVRLSECKKNRMKYMAILWGIPILLGIVFMCFVAPMFWNRFMNSLVPERDPAGGGWIGMNQKMILESANLLGKADNMSEALEMFEEGTNFAFIAILAHYGWIPSLGMLITIVAFSVQLMRNAVTIKDMYGKLLVVGISSLFIWQSIFNLLMNFNWGIKSNINIPFISYGNMDLIVNMICLALVLAVYRRKDIRIKDKEPVIEN